MLSFLPLRKLNIRVDQNNQDGNCLVVESISISSEGAEIIVLPSAFAQFVLEANMGEASGKVSVWEDIVGKPLAVSILIHAGRKVLVLKRHSDHAIQSGLWTASVTGTAILSDLTTHGENILVQTALRELVEETGLNCSKGRLSFTGLALAPGKGQAVGLFEFACTQQPEEVIASIMAWSRFHEEHETAEFVDVDRALSLQLSPISRLAVELFRGGHPPDTNCMADIREKEALQRLALLDPLTGLLNRSGFRSYIEKVITTNSRAALIVFDLDGLKFVNDRYGYGAGDKMICCFANVLSNAVQGYGKTIVARLGGDEFGVLLPNVGRTEAEGFVRHVLANPRLEASPASRLSPSGNICAGWGIAIYPEDATSIDNMLAIADKELKKIKLRRNGFALAFSTAIARFGEILSIDEAEAVFETLLVLASKVDPGLKLHCERVGMMSGFLAAKTGIGDKLTRLAQLAGRMHDIGKVVIGTGFLKKNGSLTPEERASAERHPIIGAEMLSTVPVLAPIAEAVLHHHERWDGNGYPSGLKGKEIPLIARIVTLADAWDAMTCDRPYKEAMSPQDALKEILKCKGEQFDPDLSDVFIAVLKEKGFV